MDRNFINLVRRTLKTLNSPDSTDDDRTDMAREVCEGVLASLGTPVIFRVLNGEVLAIFPTIPADGKPDTCMSYMHQGQHGAASLDIGTRARLAKRSEYLPLKKELEGIGYNLRVVKRIAAEHNQIRRNYA